MSTTTLCPPIRRSSTCGCTDHRIKENKTRDNDELDFKVVPHQLAPLSFRIEKCLVRLSRFRLNGGRCEMPTITVPGEVFREFSKSSTDSSRFDFSSGNTPMLGDMIESLRLVERHISGGTGIVRYVMNIVVFRTTETHHLGTFSPSQIHRNSTPPQMRLMIS